MRSGGGEMPFRSISFEDAEEFELSALAGVSKYRQTILNFLNSDLKKAKIVSEFPATARMVAKVLRRWVKVDEPIYITQRKYNVYLVRMNE